MSELILGNMLCKLYAFKAEYTSNYIRKGDAMKQVPLLFCLMSRRKTKDYTAVLEKVKEAVGNRVEAFVLDFEKGAWKAIREVFPNSQINGCAFHFGQAIWRKTQELGLKTTYSLRGPVYRYIRSLLALPFLPCQDIVPAFHNLEQRATSQELKSLVRYIRLTWIDSNLWTPRTWSVFDTIIRTNNDVEGWHTRINAGRRHITFYCLIPLLRREANLVQITERLVSEEQIIRNQRQKTKETQGKLNTVWAQYKAGDLSASKLLRECGYIYGIAND